MAAKQIYQLFSDSGRKGEHQQAARVAIKAVNRKDLDPRARGIPCCGRPFIGRPLMGRFGFAGAPPDVLAARISGIKSSSVGCFCFRPRGVSSLAWRTDVIPEGLFTTTRYYRGKRFQSIQLWGAGRVGGVLQTVTKEWNAGGEGDEVALASFSGEVHADLRIGADVASAKT